MNPIRLPDLYRKVWSVSRFACGFLKFQLKFFIILTYLCVFQLIIANQDQNLDRIGDSVHVLKDMSSKIGNELDEHTIMLEEIDREMHQTETKLDSVTRKLAKMTHLSNGTEILQIL